MHLVVDAVGMLGDGGAVVLHDLLTALARHPRVRRVTLLLSDEVHRSWLPEDPKIDRIDVRFARYSRLVRTGWVLVGVGAWCRRLRPEGVVLFLGMGEVTACPSVAFVQQQLLFASDAAALMGPGFRARLRVIRALTAAACRRASAVIVQTPSGKDALCRAFGISEQRVHCQIPDVTWPSGEAAEMTSRDAATVAYVGSAMPHKSVATLLEAHSILRGEFPALRLHLTWTEPELGIGRPGVECLGRIPRAKVRQLLSRVGLLVMPSLAESVGLPLLEAMDVACPVVAADLPYAHDVCGPAAVYFRPGDPGSCAAAIAGLLRDEPRRLELGAIGLKRMSELRSTRPYDRYANRIVEALEHAR